MLRLDGSVLEGGGQLVRSAVALSALSGTPVTIENVRSGRAKAGLAAQHVAAIRAVATLCQAECTGVSVGSGEVTFRPGSLAPVNEVLDIGTAGSIPLVLQAWLPVALHTGGSIEVTGGTEVAQSPTIDYLDRLTAGALRQHGAGITVRIRHRGYYPAGGGVVEVRVEKAAIRRIDMDKIQNDAGICSCSSNLPDHVAARQAEAGSRALSGVLEKPLPVYLDRRSGPATGTSIMIWYGWKGGSAVGRRGWPAEEVGKAAAAMLARELAHGGTVDTRFADQLLIYIAQYGGRYSSGECTLHARTMCWLLGEFGYTVSVSQGTEVTEFSS